MPAAVRRREFDFQFGRIERTLPGKKPDPGGRQAPLHAFRKFEDDLAVERSSGVEEILADPATQDIGPDRDELNSHLPVSPSGELQIATVLGERALPSDLAGIRRESKAEVTDHQHERRIDGAILECQEAVLHLDGIDGDVESRSRPILPVGRSLLRGS